MLTRSRSTKIFKPEQVELKELIWEAMNNNCEGAEDLLGVDVSFAQWHQSKTLIALALMAMGGNYARSGDYNRGSTAFTKAWLIDPDERGVDGPLDTLWPGRVWLDQADSEKQLLEGMTKMYQRCNKKKPTKQRIEINSGS